MIYAFVIILLLFLVVRYDINGAKVGREKWYNIVLVIFILIAGLRYRLGVDTTRYCYHFFHDYPYLWDLKAEDFSIGSYPLYVLSNSIVHSLGGKFFIFQLIHSTFINLLVFKYIKKHVPPIFLSVLIYFLWKYYSFNMEEMKASISVVLCLFANDYILEKKWMKGIILYVVGSLFHVSTSLIIITPLLFFLRFNLKGVIVLCATFIAGGIVQNTLGDYLEILNFSEQLQERASGYVQDEDYMESNLNIVGILTKCLPYLYALGAMVYMRTKIRFNQYMWMEPLLLIGIVFLILFMQIPIAYRFLNFYSIYAILFIAVFITDVAKERHLGRFVGICKATILLAPLVFSFILENKDETVYSRFYPYSSVIERSLDPQRERVISGFGGDRPHSGEY